jgi:hypothetical protein
VCEAEVVLTVSPKQALPRMLGSVNYYFSVLLVLCGPKVISCESRRFFRKFLQLITNNERETPLNEIRN